MMKKTSKLLKKCSHYLMVCEATIRSDMAKRIMHSILPSIGDINDPSWASRISSTKGVIDYNSLAAAAEGRHDIIKYGTLACVEEVRHYNNRKYNTPNDIYTLSLKYAKEGNFKDAIDICINSFDDKENWANAYGGEAWLKIAKTIKNLIDLNDKLKSLDKYKSNEKFQWQGKSDPYAVDAKINILNDIIIQLNIFDGLAHNTGSIIPKLIREESNEINNKAQTPYYNQFGEPNENAAYDYAKEHLLTTKLMDSKEFEDAAHVYKYIEPTLKETGDIHRWKDWTGKLTSKPGYNVDPETQHHNLVKVKLYKAIKKYINDIRSANARLAEIEFAGKDKLSSKDIHDEVSTNMALIINSALDSNYRVNNYKYSEFDNINLHYINISKKVSDIIHNLESLKDKFMYYDTGDIEKLHKDLLDFYNHTEMLLEFLEQI